MLQLSFTFSHMNGFKTGAIRYISQGVIHVNIHLHPRFHWEALLPTYIEHLEAREWSGSTEYKFNVATLNLYKILLHILFENQWFTLFDEVNIIWLLIG